MNKLIKPLVSKRGKVLERISSIGGYELEGTLEQAANRILEIRERFPDKRYVTLKWERDAYDEDYSLVVYWMRDETDAEWAARDAHEQDLKRDRVMHLERQLELARKALEEKP